MLLIGFVALPAAFILRDTPFVRCFVLGLALGLLSFKILGRSVEQAARGSAGGAQRGAVKYFFIRYLLAGFGLLLVARLGIGSVAAFLAGFFLPHILIAAAALFAGKRSEAGDGLTRAG